MPCKPEHCTAEPLRIPSAFHPRPCAAPGGAAHLWRAAAAAAAAATAAGATLKFLCLILPPRAPAELQPSLCEATWSHSPYKVEWQPAEGGRAACVGRQQDGKGRACGSLPSVRFSCLLPCSFRQQCCRLLSCRRVRIPQFLTPWSLAPEPHPCPAPHYTDDGTPHPPRRPDISLSAHPRADGVPAEGLHPSLQQ